MNSAPLQKMSYGRMLYQIITKGKSNSVGDEEEYDSDVFEKGRFGEDTDDSDDDLETVDNDVFEEVCQRRHLELAECPETDVRLLKWRELTNIYSGPDNINYYQKSGCSKTSRTQLTMFRHNKDDVLEKGVDEACVFKATETMQDKKLKQDVLTASETMSDKNLKKDVETASEAMSDKKLKTDVLMPSETMSDKKLKKNVLTASETMSDKKLKKNVLTASETMSDKKLKKGVYTAPETISDMKLKINEFIPAEKMSEEKLANQKTDKRLKYKENKTRFRSWCSSISARKDQKAEFEAVSRTRYLSLNDESSLDTRLSAWQNLTNIVTGPATLSKQ